MTLRFKRLPHGRGLPLPAYQSKGAAGMDLRAALDEPMRLLPRSIALIPTGFAIAIPDGYEGQVRPRSGLALKHGLSIPNTPGTIDSDYRGELKVILINLGDAPFVIERGMRIAQLIIAPVVQLDVELVTHLDETERGQKGFGSTGKMK